MVELSALAQSPVHFRPRRPVTWPPNLGLVHFVAFRVAPTQVCADDLGILPNTAAYTQPRANPPNSQARLNGLQQSPVPQLLPLFTMLPPDKLFPFLRLAKQQFQTCLIMTLTLLKPKTKKNIMLSLPKAVVLKRSKMQKSQRKLGLRRWRRKRRAVRQT